MGNDMLNKVFIEVLKKVLDSITSDRIGAVAHSISGSLAKQSIINSDDNLREYIRFYTQEAIYEAIDSFLAKNNLYSFNLALEFPIPDTYSDQIINSFYVMHPECRYESKTITPLLKRAINITHSTVISQLDINSRILYQHSQLNREKILQAIREQSESLISILHELYQNHEKNHCVFNSDDYIKYIDAIYADYFHIFFSIQFSESKYDIESYFECDPQLFKEFDLFLEYKWESKALNGLDLQQQEDRLFSGFLQNIDFFFSLDDNVNNIINRIKATKSKNGFKSERLIFLCRRIGNVRFGNCLFIAGNFGSGKTRLSLELAQYIRRKEGKAIKSVFLFVKSESAPKCIESNLAAAFKKLFNAEHTIEQYMSAFAYHYNLIIILDDVHKYFQNWITLEDMLKIIKKYSRPYVKWLILTQPGYGKDPCDLYEGFFSKYAYQWSPAQKKYQIGEWFNLDEWHRGKDTPGKIIQHSIPLSESKWVWKKKVSSTDYYTPLFSNVLLRYVLYYGNYSIFWKKDLLFPDFCKMYYSILSKERQEIAKDVRLIVLYLLKEHSLSFDGDVIDQTQDNYFCNLINSGLLIKQKDYSDEDTIYECIPDIVWIYKLAMTAKKEWLSRENVIIHEIASKAWADNIELFNSILSMVIQSAEKTADSADTKIVENWDILLDNGFEYATINSGFKCNPALRNELVKKILKRKKVLKKISPTFLHLCALGELEPQSLYCIIDIYINEFPNEISNNENLFAHMLWKNYQTMQWKEIITALHHLSAIQSLIPHKEMIQIMGEDLGRSVAERAMVVGDIETAILSAKEASEGDSLHTSNKQKIKKVDMQSSKQQRKITQTVRYLSNIYDWFCASFCDAVIQQYQEDGYSKMRDARWYTFSDSPNRYELRRNKALTFALAYKYRYYFNNRFFGAKYVKWYTNFIQNLSQREKARKKFALFLIVHTGLKEENYNLNDANKKLVLIAREILSQGSMRALMKEPSVQKFIKCNRTIFENL